MRKLLFFKSKRERRGGDPRDSRWRQRSIALEKLLPALPEEGGLRVLDLGAANPSNLDFFTRRGGQLTVADFYRSYLPKRAALKEGAKAAVFSELLAYDPKTRFDLILAWDLLNYLKKDELTLLIEGLHPYCLPGTMVLAFVATTSHIPASPLLYRVEDARTLLCEVAPGPKRPCPRYLEQELLRLMPGLNVENRFQLRNGTLEYLFSYRKSRETPLTMTSDVGRRSPWEAATPRWNPAPTR
jgi:hypothetical protein